MRDEINKKPRCPDCKGVELKHLHDSPFGLLGAHMTGSERYECSCGRSIYAVEGRVLGLGFVLDGEVPTKED